MGRSLPLAKIFEPQPPDDEPLSESWEAQLAVFTDELRQSVAIRWQESVALDRIVAEYLDLVGADVLHSEVTEMVDACRAKVLELHAAVEALGGAFELPQPTAEITTNLRARVDWEVLKPTAPASPPLPKWISETEQAERAEAEARWEAELRASKD